MADAYKIPRPSTPSSGNIANKVHFIQDDSLLNINFSKFKLDPISISGFNNHFKNTEHTYSVAINLLGKTLPIITSHRYTEIGPGSPDASGLHFHALGKDEQALVREVLCEYGYNKPSIEQMLEGNALFQFSGTMGHVYPVRIFCHKLKNTLYLLFLDTNHHIYMNDKYVKESLFYEVCPSYLEGSCKAMNYMDECFAFGYLDTQKLEESYTYANTP